MLSSSLRRGRPSLPRVLAQPAPTPAQLDPEYRQWQCAMEALRELELQYSYARKMSNRDLVVMLGGHLQALTLRCDLLLASAVAASRGWAPERSRRALHATALGTQGRGRSVEEGGRASERQVRRATQ